MLHSLVVGDDHYEVSRLAAELQPPATSGDSDWGRCAPTLCCSACRDALAALTAEDECNFDDRRHYGDALRMIHDLVRNSLVRSRHNLVENLGRLHNALLNVGLI